MFAFPQSMEAMVSHFYYFKNLTNIFASHTSINAENQSVSVTYTLLGNMIPIFLCLVWRLSLEFLNYMSKCLVLEFSLVFFCLFTIPGDQVLPVLLCS